MCMKGCLSGILLLCLMAFSRQAIAQTNVKVADYMKQDASPSQQGAAAYGKYLFHFTSEGICNIYDLEQRIHLGQMKYKKAVTKHCDTASFGTYKVDEKDEFPVIYISGENVDKPGATGRIWVYRIIHGERNWSLKLCQIITTPAVDEVGSFPDALLSNSDGCLWLVGWKTYLSKPIKTGNGAYLNFAKFRIPSLSEGTLDKDGVRNVTLSMKDAITSFVVSNVHAIQQGICLRNPKVYVPYGVSTLGYQGIDVISLEEGRVVRNINLMKSGVVEPEAVFFYQGELLIADQATTIKQLVNYKEDE